MVGGLYLLKPITHRLPAGVVMNYPETIFRNFFRLKVVFIYEKIPFIKRGYRGVSDVI